MKSDNIKVKGCGCRYREINAESTCEHLCENHEKEFILRLFNWQHEMKQQHETGRGFISLD